MAEKKITDYLDDAPAWWPDALEMYSKQPATAFLGEVVHLSDAVNQCLRLFTKTKSGNYNKDSLDSLYRLEAAVLAAMMGHLETFQRFLFAGTIEATRLVPGFDITKMCRALEKDSSLSMDIGRITAYRGQPAPIGQLIADNLAGWHDPARVTTHFKAIVPDVTFYSQKEGNTLRVLWQMRHAIAHTGGWLTQPDAQKVKELNDLGNQPLLLDGRAIEVIGRRLHPIVKAATERLSVKFTAILPATLSADERAEVKDLFTVASPRTSWF